MVHRAHNRKFSLACPHFVQDVVVAISLRLLHPHTSAKAQSLLHSLPLCKSLVLRTARESLTRSRPVMMMLFVTRLIGRANNHKKESPAKDGCNATSASLSLSLNLLTKTNDLQ